MTSASVVKLRALGRQVGRYAPHLILLGAAYALGVLVSFNPSIFLLSLILIPIWAALALVALIAAARALIRGNPSSAIWRGALVPALLVAPWPLLLAGQYSGWVGHLLVCGPYYEAQIAGARGPQGKRLKPFKWGSYLIFNDIYLVYDETDALRLPEANEPQSFRTRFAAEIVDTHWEAGTHLWGHYYVVDAHG